MPLAFPNEKYYRPLPFHSACTHRRNSTWILFCTAKLLMKFRPQEHPRSVFFPTNTNLTGSLNYPYVNKAQFLALFILSKDVKESGWFGSTLIELMLLCYLIKVGLVEDKIFPRLIVRILVDLTFCSVEPKLWHLFDFVSWHWNRIRRQQMQTNQKQPHFWFVGYQ